MNKLIHSIFFLVILHFFLNPYLYSPIIIKEPILWRFSLLVNNLWSFEFINYLMGSSFLPCLFLILLFNGCCPRFCSWSKIICFSVNYIHWVPGEHNSYCSDSVYILFYFVQIYNTVFLCINPKHAYSP